MTHDEAFGLMMDALDGVLSPAGQEALDEHLSVCSDCYAEWQSLRLVDELLLGAPMVEAPAGFSLRVQSRLETAPLGRTLGALFALGAGSLIALGIVAVPAMLLTAGMWTAYEDPSGFAAIFVWLNGLLGVSGTVLSGLWTTARLFVTQVSSNPIALLWAAAAALAITLWARLYRQVTPAPVKKDL